MQINYIKYISKNNTKGKLKLLYKHIELNFGKLAEPFVLHSINQNITAGVWAMLYETVLVDGKINRSIKETIATCISEVNSCNYCVDAHSIMIFGTDKTLQNNITNIKNGNTKPQSKEDKIILWALNNLNFENVIIQNAPFSKQEAPEIIGTAVLFHYINRMVTLFAGDTPLPTTKMRGFVMNIASKFIFGKAIRKKKMAGESLTFIDKGLNNKPFEWADTSANINSAFQSFKQQTEKNIEKILSSELITLLRNFSTNLDLISQSFGTNQLDSFLLKVEPSERDIAEFCYLTMFDSHKIHDKHFTNLKQQIKKDEDILQIAAFSSMLISESIGEKLQSGFFKPQDN